MVKQSVDDNKQKSCVIKANLEKDKAKDDVRKRIDYREEEIPNCGCIYG